MTARHDTATGHVTLVFGNPGPGPVTFTATDAYAPTQHYAYTVGAGATRSVPGGAYPRATTGTTSR